MIYEERRIILKRGTFGDYRQFVLEKIWKNLERDGHQPLCLLNGLIGAGAEDVILICGFEDYAAWESAQPLIAGHNGEAPPRDWITHENVRLMRASKHRPSGTTLKADRRAVYGARRWWIHPEDWEAFNRLSFEGVWPAMDHMGHHVLGQFRDAAKISRLEVLNLAGYHDPAHWHATRSPGEHGVPADLVETLRRLGRERESLVLSSHVSLMRAHWT